MIKNPRIPVTVAVWLTIASPSVLHSKEALPDPVHPPSALLSKEALSDAGREMQLAQASTEDAAWVPTTTQLQDVQRRLAELGFDPGVADGKIGPRTIAAIQEYQRSIDVEPDGKLTQDLYQRLTDQPDAATGSSESSPAPSFAEPTKPEESLVSPESVECPRAVGKWLFEDEQGSSFELTLEANGEVTGIPYPQHWHWQSTDPLIEIVYDSGMGQTVTRSGQLENEATIIGDAMDSRGRTWTWMAKRVATPPDEIGSDCPASNAP